MMLEQIVHSFRRLRHRDGFIWLASLATPLLMLVHTMLARLGFTGSLFFVHLLLLSATIVSSYLMLSERAQRRRIAKDMFEQRQKFEGLVNNLSVGVYRNTPGPKGNFLEANPELVAIFEARSKEELLEHTVSDFYQDKRQRKGFSQKLDKNGFVKNEELNLVTLRGRPFVGSVTAVRKYDQTGKAYFDGIIEDITERKKMEEQLLDDKTKDEAILSSIGDGLVVVDQTGHVTLMNRAAEETIGWRRADVLGREWPDIILLSTSKGERVSPREDPLFLALQGATWTMTTTTRYFYTKKDQTTFPVAITVSPLKAHDAIIGAIAVFRDATREWEIDKAKTEFVSLASHQLKTPLTSVGWYTDMLLNERAGKMSEKGRSYLEKILKNHRRMVMLVNALLNVSRIEMGSLMVEPKPTNIIEMADDVLDDVSPSIKEKHLKIEKHYDPDVPIIDLDPQLIRMVFQNLLSNAVKYTPDKGRITLIIKKQAQDLLIRVSDTGYGIPRAQQSQIFTKLFRADNVREKDTRGTGLGLYIVKAVLDQSGGSIQFDSTENEGTNFYVTLPLKGMEKRVGTKGLA